MPSNQFSNSNRRFSFQEIRALLLVGLLTILIIGLLAIGNYYLAGVLPVGGQFSLFRTASQAFLFDRVEPYSANIPASVQEDVYGRFVTPGEKPYILDIPFHLLPFFFPLALISNELFSRTFWLIVVELGLLSFLLMSFRLATIRIPNFLAVILIVIFCGSLYATISIQEGSEVIFLGVAYAGLLLALRAEMDELAGALLVISAFQWQVGGIFLLFIVLTVFWAQRWRVILAAAMILFVLAMLSFLIYPGWILPFLRASWNNMQTGYGYSTISVFTSIWPEFGRLFAWGLTILLLIGLGFEWNASRGAQYKQVVWTASLTLAVTPLLGFRTELVNMVVLLLPLIIILLFVRERWKSIGTGIVFILLMVITGIPWVVYTGNMLPYGIQGDFLFLFLPTVTILGLYWIRWWMVRLPRTWLDQVTSRSE